MFCIEKIRICHCIWGYLGRFATVPKWVSFATVSTWMWVVCHCICVGMGCLPLYWCAHGLFATVSVLQDVVCHCIGGARVRFATVSGTGVTFCHCIGGARVRFATVSSPGDAFCHCIGGCRVRFATVSRTWGWFATVSVVVVCGLPLYHVLGGGLPLYLWLSCAGCHCITYFQGLLLATVSVVMVCGLPLYIVFSCSLLPLYQMYIKCN